MIIQKLQGGLGNQLFQYAAYQKIKQRYDCFLDVSDYNLPANDGYREFLLDYFEPLDVKLVSFSNSKKMLLKSFFLKKSQYKLLNSNLKENLDFIDHNKTIMWNLNTIEIPHNTYYEGYFANARFFPVSFNLNFSIKVIKTMQELEITNKILNSNSISLHIRRTDYVNHESFKNICTMNYYIKSINYFENKNKNAVFFIFTDDIAWVESNFKLTDNKIIVKYKSDIPSTISDLYLMSICKHNIIANSTFSWWAAYLNKNVNKIVIRPDRFDNHDGNQEIFPVDWITMKG